VGTDAAAFAEFYSSASDDCLRVVLVAVRDRQIAEDLGERRDGPRVRQR
jgi:hypothetical protein